MFGFSFGLARHSLVAVADIGSASAAVALVRLESNGPSYVVSSHREFLPHEDRSPEAAAAAIAQALSQATAATISRYKENEKGSAAARELYAFLRAPWTRSKIITDIEHYKAEERVTERHIDALSKKIIASEKEFNTAGTLEAVVSRVELNGYPTAKPIGKPAKNMRVSILLSEADPGVREKSSHALEQVFPAHHPQWRSHTRALLSVVREQPDSPRNCTVIDMASEGTSIVVIRDGVLVEQVVLEEGVFSIMQRLAPRGLPEETLALLRMLEHEQCSGEACDFLLENLGKAEQDLVRVFGENFTKFSGAHRVPNDLILLAHPDVAPWLSRFFTRIDFSQFTTTSQPFSVSALSAKDLSQWVTASPGLLPDTSLFLAVALVHIESRSDS